MSKLLQSLSLISALALALVGSPLVAEARTVPARSGSSSWFADAGCWSPYGATMTNVCPTPKFWYVPLILDRSGTVDVTVSAEGPGPSSYVRCILTTTDLYGNIVFQSNWINLPYYGAPATIALSGPVPPYGTAQVDCEVGPHAQVDALNY